MINLKTRLQAIHDYTASAVRDIEEILAEPGLPAPELQSLVNALGNLTIAQHNIRAASRDLTAAGVEGYQIDVPIVERVHNGITAGFPAVVQAWIKAMGICNPDRAYLLAEAQSWHTYAVRATEAGNGEVAALSRLRAADFRHAADTLEE